MAEVKLKPAEEVARELVLCVHGVSPETWAYAGATAANVIRADRAAVLRWAADKLDAIAEGHTADIDVFNVLCAQADLVRALADSIERDDRAERITEVDMRAEQVTMPDGEVKR